jgi:hypothetical protein
MIQISPTLRAIKRDAPFNPAEPWWSLEVLAPSGFWVSVQSGPRTSSLWLNLGVQIPA